MHLTRIVILPLFLRNAATWVMCSPSVANKPKALSAGTTVELGTKAPGGCAVLLADKTLPCPNKSGPLLVTFAASVHLNRSLLRHNRDTLALSDPK